MEAEGDELRIAFQIKPATDASPALADRLRAAVGPWAAVPLRVELVPYHEFDEALELSYQRKFRYF